MTDFGRVHCIVIATKAGEVVYERFYDRFTELDKAEIRAAFQQATDNVNLASDNQDFVGTFRCAGVRRLLQQRQQQQQAPCRVVWIAFVEFEQGGG
jgi:hypothetical protein